MDKQLLSRTAAAMVAKGKGILAADESSGTCEKRFQSVNVECTEENRRTYRNLLFSTPGIEQYLSGVILFDETARQKANDGTLIPQYLAKKGILPGIKVDKGVTNLPFTNEEKVTEGLDGLHQAHEGVLRPRLPLRQVARRDHDRPRHPDACLPVRECPCARALRRDLPGSVDRADDRARGAARRRPHRRALGGSARGNAARDLRGDGGLQRHPSNA